jgi:hypothetical protein
MLNRHCVRVFQVGHLYIEGNQPNPHVKCHQITTHKTWHILLEARSTPTDTEQTKPYKVRLVLLVNA